jgi:hypothetical protein
MISVAGPSTIGKELGMSKQGADWLTRNDPDFPKPFAKEGNRRLWKLGDVRRYKRRRARRELADAPQEAAAST